MDKTLWLTFLGHPVFVSHKLEQYSLLLFVTSYPENIYLGSW